MRTSGMRRAWSVRVCAWLWCCSGLACDAQDATVLVSPTPTPAPSAAGLPASGDVSATLDASASPSDAQALSDASDRDAGDASPPGEQCWGGTPFFFFGDATGVCGGNCKVCVGDIVDDRVVGYFMMVPGASCQCAPPGLSLGSDAGASGPPIGASCSSRGGYLTRAQAELSCAGDPSACRVCPQNGADAGSAVSWSVLPAGCACPPADANQPYCGSQTGLTQAQASQVCSGVPECNVCVQQTDRAGTPTLWMAHACGCPDPYVSND